MSGGIKWVTSESNPNGVAHAITGGRNEGKDATAACGQWQRKFTERVFRKRCKSCVSALQKAAADQPPQRVRVEVVISYECNVDEEQHHVDGMAAALARRSSVKNFKSSGLTIIGIDPGEAE